MERWNILVEHFARVTDAVGKPIDRDIFETVVALNALGIPTVQSCGGHLEENRGLLLPWVDIEAADEELPKLQREEQSLIEVIQRTYQELSSLRQKDAPQAQIQTVSTHIDERAASLRQVQWEIRLRQAGPRKRLAEYLAEFYRERSVPFDRRLILEGRNRTRLHSQGAIDLYLTEPQELQRRKLLEYQGEIAAFTNFLKNLNGRTEGEGGRGPA
jgi:hypothetical protein